MIGLETRAAKQAWEAAETADRAGELKKYKSRAVEMASMLSQSGVVATLAFLASRRDETQRRVGRDLAAELTRHLADMPPPNDGIAGSIKYLIDGDNQLRMRAQFHAEMYADWLKRAVETLTYDTASLDAAVTSAPAAGDQLAHSDAVGGPR